MNLSIDACSLINLHKGGILETVLSLKAHSFYVGTFVSDECGGLDELFQQGLLHKLADEDLSFGVFTDLLAKYDLGYGETECIAFAMSKDIGVCSDDRKARKAAVSEIGNDRVTGTLFLLKECVKENFLTPDGARAVYEQMKAKGGFLPDIPDEYFSK